MWVALLAIKGGWFQCMVQLDDFLDQWLAHTKKLNELKFGGDVHLMRVTLTPPAGRHPSQDIVQPCCCGYALIFKQGGIVRLVSI